MSRTYAKPSVRSQTEQGYQGDIFDRLRQSSRAGYGKNGCQKEEKAATAGLSSS